MKSIMSKAKLVYSLAQTNPEQLETLAKFDPYFDINGKDDIGFTAMHMAAEDFDNNALASLIKAGGDINSLSKWGDTPLNCASVAGNLEGVKLLISCGADPMALDKDGNSTLPSNYTFSDEALAITRLLIDKGVNPTLCNKSKTSPLGEILKECAGDSPDPKALDILKVMLSSKRSLQINKLDKQKCDILVSLLKADKELNPRFVFASTVDRRFAKLITQSLDRSEASKMHAESHIHKGLIGKAITLGEQIRARAARAALEKVERQSFETPKKPTARGRG
jgi:ankyrin repeat protein